MAKVVGPVDVSFTALIGVDVKGDVWSCVEVPDSVELFGTGKAITVIAQVDSEPVSIALMPAGSGGTPGPDNSARQSFRPVMAMMSAKVLPRTKVRWPTTR